MPVVETTMVLDFIGRGIGWDGDTARFGTNGITLLTLSMDSWNAIGNPSEVTVTVAPSARLINEWQDDVDGR